MGWLHEIIRTSPFCDLKVSSTCEKSSVVEIRETHAGIVLITCKGTPDISYFRSLFVSIRLPKSLGDRASYKHPITITITEDVEPSSRLSSCAFAMVTLVNQLSSNEAAEKLSAYSLTYLPTTTAKNHLSYLKVFVACCGARAGHPECPPALTFARVNDVNSTYSIQEFLAGDWWKY